MPLIRLRGPLKQRAGGCAEHAVQASTVREALRRIGIFLAGIVLMLVWRMVDGRYWQERAGVVDPALFHSEPRPE